MPFLLQDDATKALRASEIGVVDAVGLLGSGLWNHCVDFL